ncbi:MAG: outer membrane beta-barrel protein [Acidobacteria bacterium]|nr:outer membrane beta-barrel protein [Acidobacteriota bacterium]
MKKKTWIVAMLVMMSWLPLQAQDAPKAEVFGGFSILSIGAPEGFDGGRENARGWQSSAAVNFNRNVGLVADFGGQYKTLSEDGSDVSDVSLRGHEFLFGPRFSARAERATPFVHVLFGGANGRASAGSEHLSKTVFAMAIGGGLDVNLSDHVALRVVQFDWVPIRPEGQWFRNVSRVGFGIVFKSGS